MYGKYADGAVEIARSAAAGQSANGTATEATGTDLTGRVSPDDDGALTMTLAGAAKAIPGFDVMDCGQEDDVFGSSSADARHWDKTVMKVFQEHSDTLI